MRDTLLIVALIGGAYLLLRDRPSQNLPNRTPEDRTLARIQGGFSAGYNIVKEGKELFEDIF